jgi:hypothetical protein
MHLATRLAGRLGLYKGRPTPDRMQASVSLMMKRIN